MVVGQEPRQACMRWMVVGQEPAPIPPSCSHPSFLLPSLLPAPFSSSYFLPSFLLPSLLPSLLPAPFPPSYPPSCSCPSFLLHSLLPAQFPPSCSIPSILLPYLHPTPLPSSYSIPSILLLSLHPTSFPKSFSLPSFLLPSLHPTPLPPSYFLPYILLPPYILLLSLNPTPPLAGGLDLFFCCSDFAWSKTVLKLHVRRVGSFLPLLRPCLEQNSLKTPGRKGWISSPSYSPRALPCPVTRRLGCRRGRIVVTSLGLLQEYQVLLQKQQLQEFEGRNKKVPEEQLLEYFSQVQLRVQDYSQEQGRIQHQSTSN